MPNNAEAGQSSGFPIDDLREFFDPPSVLDRRGDGWRKLDVAPSEAEAFLRQWRKPPAS